MYSRKDLFSHISNYINCVIKCQYDENNEGLFYELGLSIDSNYEPIDNFYNLCLKMNPIQRQFFAQPTSILDPEDKTIKHHFAYCPGNFLNSFFPQKGETSPNNYETLKPKDKLFIMKWIFSIACSIKVLLENSVNPIYLTDRTILIDSKMNARYIYSYWKKTNNRSNVSASTLGSHYYFLAPEYISNDPKQDLKAEKMCSYSLGVLILSLLNQKLPNEYFQNLSKKMIDEKILEGKTFTDAIPEKSSSFKSLLQNLLNVTPNNRKSMIEIIEFLINDENFLEKEDRIEFLNFVNEKFRVNKKIDNMKLLEIIKKNLCEVVNKKTSMEVQYELFQMSDMPSFLKLASGTTYKNRLEIQYKQIIDIIFQSFSNEVKQFYLQNKNDVNVFYLLERCFKSDEDDGLSLYNNLSLFSVKNMANNLTFYTNLHQFDQVMRLAIPNDIEISADYIEKFNDNCRFVQVYSDSKNNQKEIDFYPYLNIYSILYNMSSKNPIEPRQKVKWLHQTALALSDLHANKYTMIDFSSQNVFIDMKMNAHLFPLKLFNLTINNNILLPFDLFEKSDFILSYCPPELIQSDDSEFLIYQEKSLVYSFGIFMIELLYGFRPGFCMDTLSDSEKLSVWIKPLKSAVIDDSDESILNQLVRSCVQINPSDRKSFQEIAREFDEYLKNDDEKEEVVKQNFQLADLDEAYKKGATITYRIVDRLYGWLDLNGKFYYSIYMCSNPMYYSRFDILWRLLNGKAINLSEFRSLNRIHPIQNSNKSTEKVGHSKKIESNFEIKKIADDSLKKASEGLKKARNKILPKILHLNGLSQNSARQLLLRYGMNQDYQYRQRIEFVVKNKDKLPYGTPIKMNTVRAIVDDFIQKGFYQNIPSFSQNPNGNSVLDLSIPFENNNVEIEH